MAIGGDYTQTAGATVGVTLAGTATDHFGRVQFGQVTATGAATLDGTLNIQLAGGFEPAVGDTFQILTYASHTGTFTTVNGLNLPNNRSFTVSYGATGVTLQVVQN